ncbi:MAG: hypothetical protein IKR25_09690 [Muribaculaceae bacterium]|nr:hypothetical protein [Muribaculaceae bacterium]
MPNHVEPHPGAADAEALLSRHTWRLMAEAKGKACQMAEAKGEYNRENPKLTDFSTLSMPKT